MVDIPTIIGTIAAICTTASFVPQVLKVRRTRHAADLSMPMYIVLSFGVFMWMWYGAMLKNALIIAANAVTLALCLYIMVMKTKYG